MSKRKPQWFKSPEKFRLLAFFEGWDLFEISGHVPDGMYEGDIMIQRIDSLDSYEEWWKPEMGYGPLFKSDKAAEIFVRKLAAKGEPHAVRALECITNSQIKLYRKYYHKPSGCSCGEH